MIPQLTPEQKEAWDRDMGRYARRQKRPHIPTWIVELAAIIAVVAILAFLLFSCQGKPAKTFHPDGSYVDSLLQEHNQVPAWISSDSGDMKGGAHE